MGEDGEPTALATIPDRSGPAAGSSGLQFLNSPGSARLSTDRSITGGALNGTSILGTDGLSGGRLHGLVTGPGPVRLVEPALVRR